MPDGIRFAVGTPEPTPAATETATDTPATVGDDSPERDQQVIAYTDLADHEKQLVEKGLDGGHITCEDVPESANDFSDRLETQYVYLEYEGDRYGVYLAITDVVYASTTDPPEGDCGWLS